ncbi:hypothetical protein PIB30_031353 [Stylosanthes scabra]|uniref:Uncharacterized protein n=1 Tax=Stylosanthes scabra TaxID=79078 RepID=A0ABU6VD48_9FABA|nr:hypothetical protein [Stylosanthes scabra]
MDTEPTVEVPAADPLVTDEVVTVEVTRIDDPAAKGVTEVEGDQVATKTTEVVQVVADSVEVAQEQTVETPVQD